MRKKLVAVLLTVLILGLGLSACDTNGGDGDLIKRPGTYVKDARGYVDQVEVETVVDKNKILSVRVLNHRETMGLGSFAVDIVPSRILANQTVEVDVCAGATFTSVAIKEAVEFALEDAGADMNVFLKPSVKPNPVDRLIDDVDVLVVGSGGSAMMAAVEAQNILRNNNINNGRRVLVIEKMDTLGGNTMIGSGSGYRNANASAVATSYVNAVSTGLYRNEPRLMELMQRASNGVPTYHSNQGLHTTDGTPNGNFGMLLYYYNRFQLHNGRIMNNVRAKKIIIDSTGKATGVEAEDVRTGGTITIKAKAVVIATGGFGGDPDRVAKEAPELVGYKTTNVPGPNGDGHDMVKAAGGMLRLMEFVQIHPTVHQASSTMLTEGLRGPSVLINTEGKRFVDENNVRPWVASHILEQTPNADGHYAALMIPPSSVASGTGLGYVQTGLLKPYDTLQEVADFIGCPFDAFKQTLTEWNAWVALGAGRLQDGVFVPDPHGTNSMYRGTVQHNLTSGPYYVQWVAPGIHYTIGGIYINEFNQVLSDKTTFGADATYSGPSYQSIQGQVPSLETLTGTVPVITNEVIIEGLYAAGECTGGIHGAMRYSSGSITDLHVFGRIAGYNAARYALGQARGNPWYNYPNTHWGAGTSIVPGPAVSGVEQYTLPAWEVRN